MPLDQEVEVIGYPTLVGGEWVLREAAVLPAMTPATVGTESSEEIPSALAALGVSLQEMPHGTPVKIRATVTYSHPEWRTLFVAGVDRGVFLEIPTDSPDLQPGDAAELEMTLNAVDDAMELDVWRVTPTGEKQALPAPCRNLPEILSGSPSAQWVGIAGLVRAVYGRSGRMVLHVDVGGTEIRVYLLHWQMEQARQLLGGWPRRRQAPPPRASTSREPSSGWWRTGCFRCAIPPA